MGRTKSTKSFSVNNCRIALIGQTASLSPIGNSICMATAVAVVEHRKTLGDNEIHSIWSRPFYSKKVRLNPLDYITANAEYRNCACVWKEPNAGGSTAGRLFSIYSFARVFGIQPNAHSHCDCHCASNFILWFAIISSFTSWNWHHRSHCPQYFTFARCGWRRTVVFLLDHCHLHATHTWERSISLEASAHTHTHIKKVKTISRLERTLCGNWSPNDPMIKLNKCDRSPEKDTYDSGAQHKTASSFDCIYDILALVSCVICFVGIYAMEAQAAHMENGEMVHNCVCVPVPVHELTY